MIKFPIKNKPVSDHDFLDSQESIFPEDRIVLLECMNKLSDEERQIVTKAQLIQEIIKPDSDDGMVVYETEFKAGSYEFEYEINAVTSEIIQSEKDPDD